MYALLLLSRPSFQVRATVMAYLHCTSPRAALMPLAFLFLAWIAIGTVWYVVWLGWSVDKAFYFAAQAGFSVGFGALNEVSQNLMFNVFLQALSPVCLFLSHLSKLSLSHTLLSLLSLCFFVLSLSLSRSLALSLNQNLGDGESACFFSLLSLLPLSL
tara:strand:- start:5 stop:478 length:474 start_codon:yes stop_codon:yes gene_type:complete